ncbi:MAG: hypothetical protein ABT940_13700, partial [Alphaproteobacteria bacterium]
MKQLSILLCITSLCVEPPLHAGQNAADFKKLPTEKWSAVIPADKQLSPEWERSLFGRGAPRSYNGDA